MTHIIQIKSILWSCDIRDMSNEAIVQIVRGGNCMGLFGNGFKKGTNLSSPKVEMDPFSMAVPLVRSMAAATLLGLSQVWSVGYYEIASGAVSYYTLYYYCMQKGEKVCDSFSRWMESPWSVGVTSGLTDTGSSFLASAGYKPVRLNMFCENVAQVWLGLGELSDDYCERDFIEVGFGDHIKLFSPNDSFSKDKYDSKGELASSSILIDVYRNWLDRHGEYASFIYCNPHEYLNQQPLLSSLKICFDERILLDVTFNAPFVLDSSRAYPEPYVPVDGESVAPFPYRSFGDKEFMDLFTLMDYWRELISLGIYIRYTYLYYIVAWIISPVGPFDLGYRLLIDREGVRKRDESRKEIMKDIGGR